MIQNRMQSFLKEQLSVFFFSESKKRRAKLKSNVSIELKWNNHKVCDSPSTFFFFTFLFFFRFLTFRFNHKFSYNSSEIRKTLVYQKCIFGCIVLLLGQTKCNWFLREMFATTFQLYHRFAVIFIQFSLSLFLSRFHFYLPANKVVKLKVLQKHRRERAKTKITSTEKTMN